jgi:hypothetical protein
MGRQPAYRLKASRKQDISPEVSLRQWKRYPTSNHLMMENAQGVWGDACYPVVE